MNDLLSPGDFWVASGHHLCDPVEHGRLAATPDLWRAFLARPELIPPEEACAAERALHAALMDQPLQPVDPARIAALADPDARENVSQFLAFRDRVAAQPTLEAAWLALYREGVGGIPPILLQMLTHLVARAALEGEGDPFALRAGELLYRPQRVGIHQGATLLADEEVVEMRGRDGGFGALDVLHADNAHLYHRRSDAHDFALDIAEGRDGQAGIARMLERFIRHLFGEAVAIRAVPVIEDRDWTWHVGLDAEATSIANDLWHGKTVRQERLARILWLGVLDFADASRVIARVAGRPVYLALAMDAANRLRMKPQNLVPGLPLTAREDAA
jgi:hypothetical protein